VRFTPSKPLITLLKMKFLSSVLQALVLLILAEFHVATASAIPEESKNSLQRRFITPNSYGTHGGYFYNWWSDGTSPTAQYTNLALGTFESAYLV